jgi:hypothetical protein
METAVAQESESDRQTDKGVRCPKCWCPWLRVLYTRPLVGGKIRRCRICNHCECRFYTTETNVAGGK